jgi:hypothetical protein
VFNATFNNISVISWWSILLVEETRIPGENHRPVASNSQTLSYKNVHYCMYKYVSHKTKMLQFLLKRQDMHLQT